MGLLDTFLPSDAAQRADFGNMVSALGFGLLQGDRDVPFRNVAQSYAALSAGSKAGMSRDAKLALLRQAGFSENEAQQLATGDDKVLGLALQQAQQKKAEAFLKDGGSGEPPLPGMGGMGGGAGGATSAVPGKSASLATADPVASDLQPHQKAFLNAVAGGESGGRYDIRYTPNGGATFADLSKHPAIYEAGPEGPSSAAGRYQFVKSTWDRLGGGDFSPENQDRKAWQLAQQDYKERTGGDLNAELQKGGLTPQITAALGPTWSAFKSNPARHIATYNDSLGRYTSANKPTQVASNDPSFAPGTPEADTRPAYARPVGNEPGAYGMPGSPSGRPAAPTQVAGGPNPADMPAEGAGTAQGFVIPNPGGEPTVVPPPTNKEQAVAGYQIRKQGDPPPPVNPDYGPATQRAQAKQNFDFWAKRLTYAGMLGDAGKGLVETAKAKMALAAKFLEPAEAEKLADAAGLSGAARQAALSGAIPGNAPTSTQKEYQTYRQQELAENRTPKSQFDYELAIRQSGATKIDLGEKRQSQFEQGADAIMLKRFGGMVEEGDNAAQEVALVKQLRQLGGQIDQNSFPAVRGYLAEKGIKLGSDIGSIEAYNSLIDKLAPQQRVPGSGTTSDKDLATFKGSLPNLQKTPAGNGIVMDTLEAMARYKQERGVISEQVLNGDITRQEGVSRLRNLPDPLAAFKAYQDQQGKGGASSAAAQPSTTPTPTPATQPTPTPRTDAAPVMPPGMPAPEPRTAPTPPPAMNATERALSIKNARDAIKAKPWARQQIIDRLEAGGILTKGLF